MPWVLPPLDEAPDGQDERATRSASGELALVLISWDGTHVLVSVLCSLSVDNVVVLVHLLILDVVLRIEPGQGAGRAEAVGGQSESRSQLMLGPKRMDCQVVHVQRQRSCDVDVP